MAKKTQNDLGSSDPQSNSGTEWPCEPIVESAGWSTKWPSINTLETPLPTAEDEAANKGQLPALIAVSEYLNSSLSPNDDDNVLSDDEEEEGFEDYEFFVKLFKEDEGLREYYVKNRDNGVFCCLVCRGMREKGWKRFKNCAVLVQHAVTIAKTKKRRAHRAYCQAVCEFLGWDVHRLPSIVPSTGDKPVKAQGNADDGNEDYLSGLCEATNSISITEATLSKEPFISESQQGKGGGTTELEVNAVSKAGADGLLEDLKYTTETLKGNAVVAFSYGEPPKESALISTEEKDCQKDADVHKNLIEEVNQELLALTIEKTGDAK